MKCYYHPAQDAVALCKSCNRALCHDCAADVPPGTACKNRCEAEVTTLNLLVSRGKSAYQKTSSAYSLNAIYFAIMGLICIGLGVGLIVTVGSGSLVSIPILIMGILFLAYAWATYKKGKAFLNP